MKEKQNQARCSKMYRPLPPTKILHCPQCIKAKINSSIKGRSYVKHLNCFLRFHSHLQMLAPKKRKRKKRERQKEKGNKKKRKLKQIWHYFKRLDESLLCVPIGGDLK